MKKLFLTSLILGCLGTIIFVGCNKTSNKVLRSDFVIEENIPYTIKKGNGISVTASDVYSKKSSFRRKISIETGRGKRKISVIYITFISSDEDNIYQKMASNPNSVNGLFTIETEGQVILKKRVINGVFQNNEIIAFKVPGPFYNPNVPCNITTIHDCVAWEIEDMNWIEYSACLISAPACYAALWVSCTWEVCNNQMQYTNPNS